MYLSIPLVKTMKVIAPQMVEGLVNPSIIRKLLILVTTIRIQIQGNPFSLWRAWNQWKTRKIHPNRHTKTPINFSKPSRTYQRLIRRTKMETIQIINFWISRRPLIRSARIIKIKETMLVSSYSTKISKGTMEIFSLSLKINLWM